MLTLTPDVAWCFDGASPSARVLLGSSDVDHRRKIYKTHSIAPESLACVSADFVLQREPMARYIIKELDALLAVDGSFLIRIVDNRAHGLYMRSRDQVRHEFAISTAGRYVLAEASSALGGRIQEMRYVKRRETLQEGDTPDRWSFGIVTNGQKPQLVNALIESILAQSVPEFEILVCGPHRRPDGSPDTRVRLLDDVVLDGDIRAPISAKKNRIISAASFNNLCILHDRFTLPRTWYSRMKEYGNYFDFLCIPTRDAEGRRFCVDWMSNSYPFSLTARRNPSLPYRQWSPYAIVQGGVMVAKRNLLLRFPLEETLHWGEMEDMHLSVLAYLNGAFIALDDQNCFLSDAVNHVPQREPWPLQKAWEWVYWFRGLLASAAKFALYRRQFEALTESHARTDSQNQP